MLRFGIPFGFHLLLLLLGVTSIGCLWCCSYRIGNQSYLCIVSDNLPHFQRRMDFPLNYKVRSLGLKRYMLHRGYSIQDIPCIHYIHWYQWFGTRSCSQYWHQLSWDSMFLLLHQKNLVSNCTNDIQIRHPYNMFDIVVVSHLYNFHLDWNHKCRCPK